MQPRVSSFPNPSFSPSDKQRQKMLFGMVWTYVLILHGVFCAGSNVRPVSVKEGDSVTLHNDFKITKQDRIKWYFNNIRIAAIDLSKGQACTDVQCNEGTERFTDRLKLDHQTGSLTIMNTRSTDSGEYKLEIIRTGDDQEESFSVTVLSVLSAGSDVVSESVKEGDPVTLHNDLKTTNQFKVKWYFKNSQIAEIDLSNGETCTDVQCKDGDKRFRDRLKLDHQTGSLTIINTRTTDSGEYTMEVIYTGGDEEKHFNVTVYSVSAADKHEMEKDPEGESDTSDAGSAVSAGAVAGICVNVVVVLLVIGAGVMYYKKHQAKRNGERREPI